MKRFLALMWLVAAVAAAQVDSSQLKLKTGGGITGSTTNEITAASPGSTTAPASPLVGQEWCDANYTPCVKKRWDGTAWQLTQANISLPTQTDSTFPVSPGEGQIFWDKGGQRAWIYNSTTGLWCGFPSGGCTSTNITDLFAGTVITAPSSAPTAATVSSGAGGTMTTGNHSFKVTFANSTGGETTPSVVSNSVSPTGIVVNSAGQTVTLLTDSTVSQVTAGTHSYRLTWVTAYGETLSTTPSSPVTADATHTAIRVIPTTACPAGVIGWRAYRTVAGNAGSHLLVTNPSPGSTGYSCPISNRDDITPDGSLGVAYPGVDTSAQSLTLTSVPTGGTGTTQRRIYMSKTGQNATGPWWWVGTIPDNTTTTFDVNVPEANLVLLQPKSNYSAPLNARWTVTNNTAATTSGGCGSTGSALACYTSNAGSTVCNQVSDNSLRVAVDITTYNSGDYTIQYRFTKIGVTADVNDGTITNPLLGSMRVGNTDGGIVYGIAAGGTNWGSFACQGATWTSPMTAGNNMQPIPPARFTIGQKWQNGSLGDCGLSGQNQTNGYMNPPVGTYVWVRWIKRGNKLTNFISADAVNWQIPKINQTTGNAWWDITSTNPTQLEFALTQVNTAGAVKMYFEVDSFTLTVN